MAGMNRRQWLAGVAAAGVVAAGAGCEGTKQEAAVKRPKNENFYKADGSFDVEAAKQAYFDLMKAYHYPISDGLLKGWWVVDFSLGRFADVGMAGIFWLNEKEFDYFGHDIFLLPGQMIPEHAHVKIEGVRAKMEGWHCRRGSAYLFGEGEASAEAKQIVPASEWEFTTVHHVTRIGVGETGKLNRAEAKHFMVAGPEGAIVTEYASYHDNAALRFTDPDAKL